MGSAVISAEHHRSELQRFADRKLKRCVLQDFSGDLDYRRLDDRACEVVNLRDRHVATQAAADLGEKAGFTNVYVFPGGVEGHHMDDYPAGDGWLDADLPYEK